MTHYKNKHLSPLMVSNSLVCLPNTMLKMVILLIVSAVVRFSTKRSIKLQNNT